MTTTTYPVHVDAQLEPGLSRWLWLFKWLLAIPHYLVLAFLWLAFFVLSVVAFFAIIFTGRYPHSIFEFNVGVLRWSWRVAYYAYGALGTDRYPPFTLHDVADYPAHLEVEYPQHLSRGLVLVKWWLLAIPHYIVVGLLLGGAGYAVRGGNDEPVVWGAGLIGLLVLVAGVMLLFTGRYPQQLFDLVLGLNRWVLRVAGYAALMTDKYPPFSLDQGGHEAGAGGGSAVVIDPPAYPAPSAPSAPTPPSPHRSGWTSGRVVSLVLGSILALVALGTGIASAALMVADVSARDDDGFLMSPAQPLTTSTYAIASSRVQINIDASSPIVPETLLGDAKLTATNENAKDVFIGIAPTSRVRAYLAGVEHVTLVDLAGPDPVYRTTDGSAPSVVPEQMDWVAQSSGSGRQQITWPVENGDWTVVVMNADASPGVAVETTAGAEVPALRWLIGILLTATAVTLVVSIVLIVVPVRAAGRAGASA
jgi:hypothetical protein